MAYYIGIDLGTTNSAIVTFDGEKTRVWKTKDQTDVTPSCIFIDKKGRQFVGNKAGTYKPPSSAKPCNNAYVSFTATVPRVLV